MVRPSHIDAELETLKNTVGIRGSQVAAANRLLVIAQQAGDEAEIQRLLAARSTHNDAAVAAQHRINRLERTYPEEVRIQQ